MFELNTSITISAKSFHFGYLIRLLFQAKYFDVVERSGRPLLRIWKPLLVYDFIVRYTFVVINSDSAEDSRFVLFDVQEHRWLSIKD